MNERIRQLAIQAAGKGYQTFGTSDFDNLESIEKFAELLVKMCADIADEMEEIGCEYPGDAIVERFGFGEAEGAATWRTK